MLWGELGIVGGEAGVSACRVTDTCRDQSLPSVGPGVWVWDSPGLTPQAAPSQPCIAARPGPQPCSPAGLRACAPLISHPFFTGQHGAVGSLSWASWPPCRGLCAAPSCQDSLPAGHTVHLLCPPGRALGRGPAPLGRAACNSLARCCGREPLSLLPAESMLWFEVCMAPTTCHVHRVGGEGAAGVGAG